MEIHIFLDEICSIRFPMVDCTDAITKVTIMWNMGRLSFVYMFLKKKYFNNGPS